jgi:HSP20 family protein
MTSFGLIKNPLLDEPLFDYMFRGLPAKANKQNVDIIEGENSITLVTDVPGYNASDINVEIEEGILTISGKRQLEKEENGKKFTRRERTEETFSRSFSVAENVNPEKIQASLANGVLNVEIEKIKPEVKSPTKIKVRIG